jgi:SAM-dependent methyltransferase
MIMKRVPDEFAPSIKQPNYLIRNRLLQAIERLAPELKGRMMDFGCGQKPYKNLFAVSEYIGVDFENPGHPHLNESIDVFYDGKTLPFPDGYFDSIFCSEVFEHIFNLPEILKELNRVVKTGGLILITCPFAYCEHEIPNDYARYTSFAMRHLLEQSGFQVKEQIKTGNSLEAIAQLRLMYLHQHIYPKLKKIPLLRSSFRVVTYTITNLCALLFSRILPPGKDLYMSNVLLCQKNRNLPS